MTRARSMRAFVALCAFVAVAATPQATAADCSSGDALLGGLLPSAGNLLDASMDELGLCSTSDPVEPEPPVEPTPSTAPPTLKPELPTPPFERERPSVPFERERPSVVEDPDGTPAIVEPIGAVPNALLVPIIPGAAQPGGDEPHAAHRTASTSTTMPVGIGAGLIAIVAFGWIAAVLGRRRGARTALSHAGTALSLIDDAIVVVDRGGMVTMMNEAGARMLGAEGRGRPLAAVMQGRDGDDVPLASRTLTARRPTLVEGTLETEHPIPVRLAVTPAHDAGSTLIVIREMRETRRLERMKTEILANVGHELRTPLTSALGFARLAQTRELGPERTKAFVSAVVESCERLERVIDLLVDVATVEAGKVPTNIDRVDVPMLVRERAARWERRAPSHVLNVRVTGRPRRTVGNHALLAHAIDELVDNAIKFSPDGGLVTIEVAGRDGTVELTVADQGIGIAEDHLGRLFDDFGQLDPSPTRRFGGLGLGLGFVRRVVAAHGGSIGVSSVPGEGSSFRVILPVRDHRGSDLARTTAPVAGDGVRASSRPVAVSR